MTKDCPGIEDTLRATPTPTPQAGHSRRTDMGMGVTRRYHRASSAQNLCIHIMSRRPVEITDVCARPEPPALRYRDAVRVIAGVITLVLLTADAGAQTVRLRDIVARLDAYLQGYEERLASVVSEEEYRQWVEQGPKTARSKTSRMLRSDFALTLTSERNRWMGYRDTFDVDGVPVRDRDERLQRLLSSGAVGQAARIADQNARFNLGDSLISRNINIPTFALEMMNPRIRDRFRVRHTGVDAFEGRAGWLIEFRERERPTLVRTPQGRDQASRVVALVDIQTGEVLYTVLTWERVEGLISVYYGQAAGIPVPVPIRMAERYVTSSGAVVAGEATYANFRQFETSARIIVR